MITLHETARLVGEDPLGRLLVCSCGQKRYIPACEGVRKDPFRRTPAVKGWVEIHTARGCK